jgi:hypothetical protein
MIIIAPANIPTRRPHVSYTDISIQHVHKHYFDRTYGHRTSDQRTTNISDSIDSKDETSGSTSFNHVELLLVGRHSVDGTHEGTIVTVDA